MFTMQFTKVKMWMFVQTLTIIVLVILIARFYIHLPKKEIPDPFVGERIGTIKTWVNDNNISNIVTSNREIYFFNQYLRKIFIYKDADVPQAFAEVNFIDLYGLSREELGFYPKFDVDSHNNLYFLREYNDGILEVDIYQDSKLYESIRFPNITSLKGFKVIERKIVFCYQEDKNNLTEQQYYFQLYDMDSKKTNIQFIPISSFLSFDRSENEIAIVSITGEVLVYKLQNEEMVLDKQMQITNISDQIPLEYYQAIYKNGLTKKDIKNWKKNGLERYFLPTFDTSLLFTKEYHQMVLKIDWEETKYFFLKAIDDKYLKMLPLQTNNLREIIKLNYRRTERLVSISHDQKDEDISNTYQNIESDKLDGLYLIKE